MGPMLAPMNFAIRDMLSKRSALKGRQAVIHEPIYQVQWHLCVSSGLSVLNHPLMKITINLCLCGPLWYDEYISMGNFHDEYEIDDLWDTLLQGCLLTRWFCATELQCSTIALHQAIEMGFDLYYQWHSNKTKHKQRKNIYLCKI